MEVVKEPVRGRVMAVLELIKAFDFFPGILSVVTILL